MKPTKQQSICLKLAQWLGLKDARRSEHGEGGIEYLHNHHGSEFYLEFDPFHTAMEGRAQFAECFLKAWSSRMHLDRYSDCIRVWLTPWGEIIKVAHDGTPSGIAAAILEAIFYAIGGTAGEWE